MASDRIVITADSAHPEAAKVRQLVDSLATARNLARHLKSTQPHYGTGTANDYAELAAALGSNGADAQSLKNLIGTVADELSGTVVTATAQFIDRVG